jgi:quercetin dioxygenase-like cupin family protein
MRPVTGNATDASRNTRGWFLGHFMPGDDNPLRSNDVEVKWFAHAKGETRPEWSPASDVRTLNVLIRGRFVLLFPDHEVPLEKEGDFVLFGPDIAHSYRCEEDSLILTVRWPSVPAATAAR